MNRIQALLKKAIEPKEQSPPDEKPTTSAPRFGKATITAIVILLVAILFLAIRSGKTSREKPRTTRKETSQAFTHGATGFDAFSSEQERYNYLVEKTEGDYASLKKSIGIQKEINKSILQSLEEVKANNKILEDTMNTVETDIAERIEKAISQMEARIKAVIPIATEKTDEGYIPAPGRLRIINVPALTDKQVETKKEKSKYVYLPTGSFVKCTLLTGAYAPVDKANPLPVLLSVDQAFFGPGRSRIPIKSTLIVCKAVGDVNSERAILQATSLAYVSPEGKVFETHGNLGWVSGEDGTLGIPGKVVRRTGRELTGAFATGFLSGAAEALSQAETAPTDEGRVVAGSVGKYAGYSGLSQAASTMSRYYADLLDQIVSAVKIDMGEPCYLIMQKGVQIEGLTPQNTTVSAPFSGVD